MLVFQLFDQSFLASSIIMYSIGRVEEVLARTTQVVRAHASFNATAESRAIRMRRVCWACETWLEELLVL